MGQVFKAEKATVYINGKELKPFDPTKDENYLGKKASITMKIRSLGPDYRHMANRKKRIREKHKKRFCQKFGLEYIYPTKARQRRAAKRFADKIRRFAPEPASGSELDRYACLYAVFRKEGESDESLRKRTLEVMRRPICRH